jgi:DNA topoisomerase-3
MALIEEQKQSPVWGNYCSRLINGEFKPPLKGKNNDKAHPPIHPTKFVDLGALTDNNHKRVYELIVRHFLGTCSNDALGFETKVKICIAGEFFSTSGLVILERNYLEIYTFDFWSDKELPNFQRNQEFNPQVLTMTEGKTAPPNPLTEEELISLMYKNGIGTDATIPQHIETVQHRDYAEKQQRYFYPTLLGTSLVEGYNAMNLDLAKPRLRAEMEAGMQAVSNGRREPAEFVRTTLSQMEQVFREALRSQQVLDDSVGRHFQRL